MSFTENIDASYVQFDVSLSPGDVVDKVQLEAVRERGNKQAIIKEITLPAMGLKVTATEIVAQTGCDYVKQATGTTPNWSYTLGDVKLLKAVAAGRCKVKASGWIMNIEDAIGCVEFGAERIGNSLALQWLDEFDQNRWYD